MTQGPLGASRYWQVGRGRGHPFRPKPRWGVGASHPISEVQDHLDLGSRLAHRFVEQRAPQYEADVHGIFRRKGAYGRFKTLLERRGLLGAWHEFEQAATQAALLAWAEEEGMSVGGIGAPVAALPQE